MVDGNGLINYRLMSLCGLCDDFDTWVCDDALIESRKFANFNEFSGLAKRMDEEGRLPMDFDRVNLRMKQNLQKFLTRSLDF
jgi:hypothetical protein